MAKGVTDPLLLSLLLKIDFSRLDAPPRDSSLKFMSIVRFIERGLSGVVALGVGSALLP